MEAGLSTPDFANYSPHKQCAIELHCNFIRVPRIGAAIYSRSRFLKSPAPPCRPTTISETHESVLKSRCNSAPGSVARMNASPTRNVSTPAARIRFTSSVVCIPLSVTT
jgi:hypothetical protein